MDAIHSVIGAVSAVCSMNVAFPKAKYAAATSLPYQVRKILSASRL